MNRIKPKEQIYSTYTNEDFMVWNILFNRQMHALANTASSDFLKAVNEIGFCEDEIPNFEKINQRLQQLTGWKIITVQGICPPNEFFQFLFQKTFTATCWLRKMNELDYLEEPDMFHDVFGHVPLLTNTAYCEFFQSLGALALKNIGNQQAIDMLERLYWFTIEFGLINENDGLKIYGSGIISSTGETQHALSNASRKHAFNVQQIMQQSFRTDVMQDDYFVIKNFEELINALPLVEKELEKIHSKFIAV